MPTRVLTYDGPDSQQMFSNPANWRELLTNMTASLPPTSSDILLFGPGSPDLLGDGTGIGSALFETGDSTTLTGIGAAKPFSFSNIWIDPNAALTVSDSAFAADNVSLATNSTLTLGAAPLGGVDTISQLWNEGGSLLNNAKLLTGGGSVINNATLLIGGPGFVQVGVATPDETNVHTANTDFIELGDVKQGSTVAPIIADLLNGSSTALSGGFVEWGDGGFTVSGFNPVTLAPYGNQGDFQAAGTIGVNTAALGNHVEIVRFSGGDTLVVTDHMVA